MNIPLVRCMTMVILAFWVNSAAANSIDVNFVQENGPGALSGQLGLTIYDNDQGSGTPDQVLFSFTNGVGISSSIEEIYIDGNDLFSSVNTLFESRGVDFTANGGGSFGGFGFTAANTASGIDNAREYLGIVFNLIPGVTLDNVIARLEVPGFITIPDPGGQGSPYINQPADNGNNPVPEPTSMVLFGIGTAGLAGLRRMRNKKQA